MNQNLIDNQFNRHDDAFYLSKNFSVTNSPSGKRKKFPAKQIYNVWQSVKKFNQNSIEKLKRNSPKLKKRQTNKRFVSNNNRNFKEKAIDVFDEDEERSAIAFRDAHRLTASHPELSCSNLAQLSSNYQSFDDINLITIHHNSDNYISDNIEFHKNADLNVDNNKSNATATNTSNSPTSFFFTRFRSSTPPPIKQQDSINESVKEQGEQEENKSFEPLILPKLNTITSASCTTFLPQKTTSKRPHSSGLNCNDKKAQFKQPEFSGSEEDLLLNESISNFNCTPTSKRRDSFLLKLLKKRKSAERSIERHPLERASSTTNYEYYNHSIDEDYYENFVTQNPQEPTLFQFYLLEIYLNSASNLRAADRAGTSDPYVKFKIANKVLFKSRIIFKTLNPKFDEFLTLPIDNLLEPVQIKVYDYDFGFTDDYLGAAQIDLTRLKLNEPGKELSLKLSENGKPTDPDENWGTIQLCCTLLPKTLNDRELYFNKDNRLWTDSKKHKIQEWDSVVNIVLIEARNLPTIDDKNGLADPYVRFKLGNEKYKSKIIYKNLNPVYNEKFDLHTFASQSKVLEISVYDYNSFSDQFIGKNAINLNCLNKEETHELIVKLDNLENAELALLLTISGIKNVDDKDANNNSDYAFLAQTYCLEKSFQNLNDVGFLVVKVIKAEDLLAADFSGKSDPFVVLELVNNRLQTNTEYKTLAPIYNKTFEFRVRDVHEPLLITVFDEDSDKNDFLGQIVIPLLNIKNDQLKWYQLKDQTALKATKGRILLQLTLFYNPIRAALKTLNPKDKKILKHDNKFKRSVFVYNVNRLKLILMDVYFLINYLKSCFNWESKLRSISAMAIFGLSTYFFQPYMLPLFVLAIFFKNYLNQSKEFDNEDNVDQNLLDENEDDEDDKSGKKTFKEKIQILQETSAQIQNVLGEIASYGERIYNTLNYSVPFLSLFAIMALISLTIILYLIPFRYLILIWGINKFTKKLRTNSDPNNELLDFLSRVPDKNDIMIQKEVHISHLAHRDSTKNKKKKN